jgi:hypothetical protein
VRENGVKKRQKDPSTPHIGYFLRIYRFLGMLLGWKIHFQKRKLMQNILVFFFHDIDTNLICCYYGFVLYSNHLCPFRFRQVLSAEK